MGHYIWSAFRIMRGIKKPGTKTVTAVTRGVFNDDERLRTDFYRMLEHR